MDTVKKKKSVTEKMLVLDHPLYVIFKGMSRTCTHVHVRAQKASPDLTLDLTIPTIDDHEGKKEPWETLWTKGEIFLFFSHYVF